MNAGERIADLRKGKRMSQSELAKQLHVAPSTIGMWETNQRAIKDENLRDLADFFNVSVDFILGRGNIPYYSLTDKEKLDIGQLSEKMLEGLHTDEEVDYFGEPMNEEDKARMKTILEMGLQLNKEKAKKKFTNKKYRNDK